MKTILLLSALGAAVSLPFVARPRGDEDSAARVERGRYLVNAGACNDCHTPWVLGPEGPMPDPTRTLSGHPEGMELPAPPEPVGPWIVSMAATNTAWAGPWGVSFTANLTPDPETGLGTWTADTFVAALKTGKHMGLGRPILPPMPWPMYGKMNEEDLRSIFAYLQSLPPIKNRVPEPVSPSAAAR